MLTDYEELILLKQDIMQLAEDECCGDCDRCPFVEYVYATEYWDDPYPVCGLRGED